MSSRQLSLFDNVPNRIAGLDQAVKAAMNEACRDHALSRELVLDRMNELARMAGIRLTKGNARELSLATFEKWLNPADAGHMPGVRALTVFCAVVGDTKPLAVMAETLGGAVISEEQRARLERAEIDDEIKRLQRRRKHLQAKEKRL